MFPDGRPVPPHSTREQCESWAEEVLGCGKPFRIVDDAAVACDYI